MLDLKFPEMYIFQSCSLQTYLFVFVFEQAQQDL